MSWVIFVGVLALQNLVLAENNLNQVQALWTVPEISHGVPAPGKRVLLQLEDAQGADDLYHVLYLPTDWRPDASWPLVVEYPGNGGYANELGDTSDGTMEGCMMGYGLSEGRGFLWLCPPIVGQDQQHAIQWWGDIEKTKAYCIAAIDQVCRDYGGDPRKIILMGFSRGSIACNYLGLHDDRMSRLWAGFMGHSHYEGSFRHPAPDEPLWQERYKRLGERPLFLSHERSVAVIQSALEAAHPNAKVTFATLSYPNHSARWVLCDVPLRRQARQWLMQFSRSRP